jgi:site-specific DNA-methyltransferase (adenine-specific)
MKPEFKTMHGNEYSTPQAVFNYFNKIYNFTHDLAASDLNYKCNNYFTMENDSLSKDWHKLEGYLWLNPPYSPLRPWIEKAQKEADLGAKVCLLVPPFLNTKYIHNRLPNKIIYIVGRLAFEREGQAQKANTKDSVLLVFNDDVVRGASSWLSRSELLKETL